MLWSIWFDDQTCLFLFDQKLISDRLIVKTFNQKIITTANSFNTGQIFDPGEFMDQYDQRNVYP